MNLVPLQELTVWILPVLFTLTMREAARAYVAYWLGDRTGEAMGRVTLNPLNHVDPVGTILVPVMGVLTQTFLFGWAKPVPIELRNLRHARRDMLLVSLAGPGMNILLAILAILLFYGLPLLPDVAIDWTQQNLKNLLLFNLVIAVFNMLPLPPLDGGRVAVALLPNPLSRQLAELEPIGMWIILGVVFLIPAIGNAIHVDLNLYRPLVLDPALWLGHVLIMIFGSWGG
jgi:Zn-dependent protease